MGIELPPELADVAQATGAHWPQADEDKMHEQAGAYREAAGKINKLSGDADAAAHGALNSFQGSAADGARSHWNTFVAPDTGHLPATAQGCHQAADRLEHAADQIGSAKVELVRQLTSAAKNKDAAHQAAAAGFPGALAGLHTTLQGTATNVAAVHSNLTDAVRLDSGVTTRDANLPVGQSGHGSPQSGLLGAVDSTVHGVSHTATGTTDAVLGNSGPTHGLTRGATGLAGGGLGATADHLGRGEGNAADGLTGGDGGPGHGGGTGSANGAGWTGGRGDRSGLLGSLTGGPEHHTGPIQLPGQGYRDSGFDGGGASPSAGVRGGDQAPIEVVRASADVAGPTISPVAGGPVETGAAGPSGGVNPSGGPGQLSFGGPDFGHGGGGGAVAGGVGGPVAGGGPGREADGGFPGQRSPQQFAGGGTSMPPSGRPSAGGEGFVGHLGGGGGSQARQPGRGGVFGGAGRPEAPVGMDAGGGDSDRPARRSSEVVAFLMYLFPLGHLPVPASKPARQLPAPPGEFFVPGGLRFAPQDHPQSDLVADTAALRAALADDAPVRQRAGVAEDHPAVAAASVGYDPLGGEHERDWDRRFLVRPADESGERRAEYAWPPPELFPEGGCAPEATEAVVLAAGTEVDRFGGPEGRVLSLAGTPFGTRALPPEHRAHGYHQYRVLRPLPVWRTVSAAWFAQPGGAVRFRTTYPVADLVAFGYLEPRDPAKPEINPAEEVTR